MLATRGGVATSCGVAAPPPPELRLFALLLLPPLLSLLLPLRLPPVVVILLRSLTCGCSSTIKSIGVPMSGARSHIVLHRRLDLRTRGCSMTPSERSEGSSTWPTGNLAGEICGRPRKNAPVRALGFKKDVGLAFNTKM